MEVTGDCFPYGFQIRALPSTFIIKKMGSKIIYALFYFVNLFKLCVRKGVFVKNGPSHGIIEHADYPRRRECHGDAISTALTCTMS